MASEARKRAVARYLKQKTKAYLFHCNIDTEADIISKLESVPNRAGYIKRLVRDDCRKVSDSGNGWDQQSED